MKKAPHHSKQALSARSLYEVQYENVHKKINSLPICRPKQQQRVYLASRKGISKKLCIQYIPFRNNLQVHRKGYDNNAEHKRRINRTADQ